VVLFCIGSPLHWFAGVFSVRVNSNALAPATASLSVPSVQGTIDSKRASVLMMSGEWGLLLRFS